MPDMPPDFYVPAFAFMVTVISGATAAGKILWARHVTVADRQYQSAIAATEAMQANTAALREHTQAMNGLRAVMEEVAINVREMAGAPIRRPRR